MDKKPTSLEEAHSLIQEAMKTVIQELIIVDEEGEHHIVYIHNVEYDPDTKGIMVDYSTPSDRDVVYPHVIKALTAQIKEAEEKLKKETFWYKLKTFVMRVVGGYL